MKKKTEFAGIQLNLTIASIILIISFNRVKMSLIIDVR